MIGDSVQQWQGLGTLAGSGQLYLKQGVAGLCAKRCAQFAAALDVLREDAKRLSTVDGFGKLPSGVALATKFGLKAAGGDYSMEQAIDDHIKVVLEMQQTFEKIEAMYSASEERNASGIDSAGKPLDR